MAEMKYSKYILSELEPEQRRGDGDLLFGPCCDESPL